MENSPARNSRTGAVIAIIIVIILLVLLIVLAFRLINVTVIEPTAAEVEMDIEPLPAPEPEIIDEYIPESPAEIYPQDEVRLSIEEFIDTIAVQGDGIYYSYTGWNFIAVTRISADGTEEQRIEIEWDSWEPWINAFEVTSDGNFLFLLHEFEEDGEIVYFLRYNAADSTLTYQNISDQLSLDLNTLWIHTIVFDADGNIFLHVPDNDTIYILDREGIYRGRVDLGDFWVAEAFQIRDGQIALLGRDEDFDLVLKGIDLEANTLTEITAFDPALMWLWGAYSGQNSTEFDLFLDFEYDDVYGLYGYNIQTGELTFLFDWEETGIIPDWDTDIVFMEDDRVAALQRHSTRNRFWSELIIFTP